MKVVKMCYLTLQINFGKNHEDMGNYFNHT